MEAYMVKILFLCSILLWNVQSQINLTGNVTDKSGNTLKDVIITLERYRATSSTDAQGIYAIHALSAKERTHNIIIPDFSIRNNEIIVDDARIGNFSVEVFTINGVRIFSRALKINTNTKIIPLPASNNGSITILRVKTDNSISIMNKKCSQYHLEQVIPVSSCAAVKRNATAVIDTLRASKAGYASVRLPVNNANGVINFVLDSLKKNVGSNPMEDGSADRIAQYGVNQYFWGQLHGKEKPIVMITHAVSADAVDVQVVFNPCFFDLTYGVNALGWKHTYQQLVKSDHVAIAIVNGNKDTVFSGKLDLISVSAKSLSGYACLGPFGGDGAISSGDPQNIISYGSSLDDNINYHGYHLFVDSPKTDTMYTPDPLYPNWQFYPIYRISLKKSAFGQSGYGSVEMTYCHASPSKDQETVNVTEKTPPPIGTPEDPFRYYTPITTIIIQKPPVDTIPHGGVD
jgi:hypothetical protein